MKRLFAAVHLTPDPPFLAALRSLQHDLNSCRINWTQTSQLHLTLKFFGETAEDHIPAISSCLLNEASKCESFEINSHQLGIFGSHYKPRVLWLGFSDDEPLKTLGNNILDACEQIGFPSDRQNFVPHLTLGRIKEISSKTLFRQCLDKHRQWPVQSFNIEEIILFESILSPKGPTYIPLFRTPLNHDTTGNS